MNKFLKWLKSLFCRIKTKSYIIKYDTPINGCIYKKGCFHIKTIIAIDTVIDAESQFSLAQARYVSLPIKSCINPLISTTDWVISAPSTITVNQFSENTIRFQILQK